MNASKNLVVFKIDQLQFAFYLQHLIQVIHAVEVISIPKNPEHLLGAINYHGTFLPVVNMRKLFGLKNREIELADQFILIESSKMKMAIWVDAVDQLVTISEDEIAEAKSMYVKSVLIEGVFQLNEGMVLISNIDQILNDEEIQRLLIQLQDQKETIDLK